MTMDYCMVTKPRHPSVLTPFCAVNLILADGAGRRSGRAVNYRDPRHNLVQRDGKVVGVEADGDVIKRKR